jgi:hypothetical protein
LIVLVMRGDQAYLVSQLLGFTKKMANHTMT